MKSNLFIELTEEQQEVVAGGIDGLFNNSAFKQRITAQTGSTTSGPNGSVSLSSQTSNAVNTSATEVELLGFNKAKFGGISIA